MIPAEEAERLSKDTYFNKLLDEITARAKDNLAAIDASDRLGIVRLQQRVSIVEEIRSNLKAAVITQATSSRPVA